MALDPWSMDVKGVTAGVGSIGWGVGFGFGVAIRSVSRS